MSDLVDISFVIIAIALLGFIAKDSFYASRRINVPYELRDESERLFSHVTIGLFIVCICWMAIITFIIPIPDLARAIIYPIIDQFSNLSIAGVISEEDLNKAFNTIIIYGNLLTIASIVFVLLIFVSTIAGIVATLTDKRAISVSFGNSTEPKRYRRILKESEDFFYFQSLSNFRQWEGIPKDMITGIKNIRLPEKSIVNQWIFKNCTTFFKTHPRINTLIGVEKNRRLVVLALLGVLMAILLIVTVIPNLNSHVIIRILFLVLTIPIIGVMLIEMAFTEETEDDI